MWIDPAEFSACIQAFGCQMSIGSKLLTSSLLINYQEGLPKPGVNITLAASVANEKAVGGLLCLAVGFCSFKSEVLRLTGSLQLRSETSRS